MDSVKGIGGTERDIACSLVGEIEREYDIRTYKGDECAVDECRV